MTKQNRTAAKSAIRQSEPGISVGLWIDRREAISVRLVDDEASIDVMASNLVDRRRPAAATRTRPSKGRGDLVSESKSQQRWHHELHRYVQKVAGSLQSAERIYIAGPGQAKQLLYEAIEVMGTANRIVAVQTADRMTRRQFAARVKGVFRGDRPAPDSKPPS